MINNLNIKIIEIRRLEVFASFCNPAILRIMQFAINRTILVSIFEFNHVLVMFILIFYLCSSTKHKTLKERLT